MKSANAVLSTFKHEVEARSRPIDTLELQLESLYSFATELGYSVRGSYYDNQGFFNFKAPREGLKFISFDTMKYYHNNPFNNYSFKREMNVALAAAHKLVKEVKLQRTKVGIKVQNHYVTLVTETEKDCQKLKLAVVCPSLTEEQLDKIVSSDLLKQVVAL